MVALVSGSTSGVSLSSAATLGQSGVSGSAAQGRSGQQVYVNVATGNLVLQSQDEALIGVGPDIASLRTYNSQGRQDDDAYASGLQPAHLEVSGSLLCEGSSISRIDRDGAAARYRYDASTKRYASTDGGGAYDTIVYDRAAAQLVFTDGDTGLAERYGEAGCLWRLLSASDTDGNALAYRYHSDGQVASALTSAGEGTYFDYSGGLLTRLRNVTLQQGAAQTSTRVRYQYDSCARLQGVTVDLSPGDNAIADNNTYITRYQYDGDSRRVAAIVQTDGSALSFTYVCIGGDYRIASISNALGQITRYSYDSARRATTVTDPLGLQTSYAYDSAGQLVRVTGPVVNGAPQVRSYAYNERGDLVQVTDAQGQATVMQYDSRGNQVLQRDAAGNTVARAYDAQNQLLAETVYLQTDPDGAGALQPGQPLTRRNVHDAGGRNHLRFTVSAEGRVTEYRYNSLGQRSSEIVYAAAYAAAADTEAQLVAWASQQDASRTARSDYQYDTRGQLRLQSRYTAINADGSGSPEGRADTYYLYDPSGLLLQTITATGGLSHYTYDGLNRLLSATDALGQTTLGSYDDAGARSTVTAANGLHTVSSYDRAGRLVNVAQTDAASASLGATRYLYDNDGRLRHVEDATGVQRWLVYDAAGRQTGEVDGDGSLTETVFDANDQAVQTVKYATPVASILSPVMQAEVFRYSDTSARRVRSLDELGLNAAGAGAALTPVTSFQTSDTSLAQARRLLQPATLDSVAMRLSGSITVFAAGDFTFYTRSTAGSRLYVDGQLVVDNDGLHGARTITGSIRLAAGRHTVVEVCFGAGSADNAFGLGVQTTSLGSGFAVSGSSVGASATVPALPADATVASTELQLVDITALGQSWQSEIRVALAGATRLAATSVASAQSAGAVNPNPLSLTLPDISTAGGPVSLTLSDTSNDPGIDYTVGAARLIVTYGRDALAAMRPAPSAADSKTWRILDAAGRVVREINALGSVAAYRYDGAGRLVQRTDYATQIATSELPAAATSQQAAPPESVDDRVTRTFYDADGLLRAVLDAEGYLTETRYDAAGQPVARILYATPTAAALRAAGTLAQLLPNPSADDSISRLRYDARGQLVEETDGEGYRTAHRYDGNGNLVETVRYATAAPGNVADQRSTYSYDLLNRRIAQTDAAGTVTRYDYDSVGRLVRTSSAVDTDALRVQTRRYDLQGRLVAELGGEGSALLAGAGAAQAAVWASYATAYRYDAAGRLASMTDANGNRTLYYYNVDSQLVASVNALGEVESRSYNALNQQVAVSRYARRIPAATLANLDGGLADAALAGALAGLADPLADSRSQTAYNRDGNIASVTDAMGYTSSRRYNSFGQVTAVTTPVDANAAVTDTVRYDRRGLQVSSTRDSTGLAVTTTQQYDAFGRVIRSTDANGNIATRRYDRLGRTVASVDPLGGVETSSYDAYSRIVSRTDALGNTTTLRYDDRQRSVTITTPEGVTVTTSLNRHGQTQSVTDGNGNVSSYRYDRNGMPVAVTTPLATSAQSYDRAGRLIETVDANGVRTVLSYDAANRVLSRTLDPDGLAITTSYAYDAQGRTVRSTDANGVATVTAWDRRGQLLQQLTDPDGLALATRYRYDARGLRLTVTDANGVSTAYQYDGLGRRVAETRDPGGLALTTGYRYDGNGNVVASTDANGQTSRYVYDAAKRMVYSVDAAGGVSAFSYDADGRLLRTVRHSQPIALTGLPDALHAADIAQRIAADPDADAREDRVYDRDGRLRWTLVSLGGGQAAVTGAVYDGNNNVIERRAYASPVALATWQPGAAPAVRPDAMHDQRLRSRYDAANRVTAQIDGAGALTVQRYDGNGNLTARIRYATLYAPDLDLSAADAVQADPAHDDRQRHGYDAANRRTWSMDGTGAVTLRRFDANGNLVRSIARATFAMPGQPPATVSASAGDRITDLTYDAANRQTWQIDTLGGASRQDYDRNGNIVLRIAYASPISPPTESSTPLIAADIVRLLAADRAQDRVLRYVYDHANRQTWAIDAEGAASATRYDALGQVLSITRYAQPLAAVAANSETAIAAAVTSSPGHDRVSRQLFDAAGRVVASIDALGYVTVMRYDAQGRLLQRSQYARPLAGGAAPSDLQQLLLVLPRDASQDRQQTTRYDAAGRISASTDALGYTESWTLDALGNRLTYTNAKGAPWRYDYDAAGRLTVETSPQTALTSVIQDSAGKLVVNEAASGQAALVTRLRYDALGNLLSRTEAAGLSEERTTRYQYDALGRQVRTDFPVVGVYNPQLDNLAANGHAGLAARTDSAVALYSETRYDALGNAVAGRDVAGQTSTKVYDRLGRLAWDIDAMGQVTGYRRNAWGDVVELTRYAVAIPLPDAMTPGDIAAALGPAQGRTLRHDYDRAGRLIQVSEPDADAYDADASAAQQYFHAARLTRYRYNAWGERTETAQLKNPLSARWIVSRDDYDQRGQKVASLDALGYLTTVRYDAWGNVVLHTEFAQAVASVDAFMPPPASADDRATRTTYDRNNRQTSVTLLDVEYSDAPAGGESLRGDLVTSYGYDALGNVTRVTDAAGAATYSYYDSLGRISAVAAPARSSTIGNRSLIPLTVFRRDAYGNVVAQADLARGAASATESGYVLSGASADDHLAVNRYDSHGHLLQSTDPGGIGHYSAWDARGQLAKQWQLVTAADGVSLRTLWQAWRYDALGRQSAGITPLDDGRVTSADVAYNAFGEVVRRGADGGWQEYFDYDQAGRLWRTNQQDGLVKVALYDLQGNVTAEISSDGSSALTADTPRQAAQAAHTRRTDTRYDLLGRVVQRLQPAQDSNDIMASGDGLLRWARPAAGTQQTWRMRSVDSDTWQSAGIIDYGDGDAGVDLRQLAPGDYLYALEQVGAATRSGRLHISPGQAARQVGASGLPRITDVVVRDSTLGGLPGTDDAAAYLVWGNPGARLAQQFLYRAAGSDAPWSELPVTARGNGYYGVDRRAIAAGQYDYQLLATPAGAAQPSRVLTGTAELADYQPGAVRLLVRDADGRALGSVLARVIQWQLPPDGATATLRVRAQGSDDWQILVIDTEVMGSDAEGRNVGVQKASLDALRDGLYDYELTFLRNGQPVALSSGAVSIAAGALPTITDSTPAYQPGYTVGASGPRISVSSDQATRPDVRQSVDRWGNVTAVNDPRSLDWISRYRYNAADQMVEQTRPDAGPLGAPVSRRYYDRLGRQVGQLDANGNLNLTTYDAAGQVMLERHADGGIVQRSYDAYGNEVRQIDPNGRITTFTYDKQNHRIQTQHAATPTYTVTAANILRYLGNKALTETSRYDQAGRLVAQTNGNNDTTQTRYDLRGNVVDVIDPLGAHTSYRYDIHNRRSGMTDANGNSALWRYDDFGRLLGHIDIGGAVYQYTYDAAGQLTRQTNSRGQDLRYSYDSAGHALVFEDAATALVQISAYRYDAAGQRLSERITKGGVLYQDNTLRYDSLGRLVQVSDRADGLAQVTIAYDNAGNRTRIVTDIVTSALSQHSEGWYRYDAMNRQVVVNAVNEQGDIGPQGHRIAYDLAGNRTFDTWWGNTATYSDDGGIAISQGETTAAYRYDALNRLTLTSRDGMDIEHRYYDAASRVVQQGASGLDADSIAAWNAGVADADKLSADLQTSRYDAGGRLLYQVVTGGDGQTRYELDYSHTYDAVGNLLSYRVIVPGENGYTNSYHNEYTAFETYALTATRGASTLYQSGASTRQYDANGYLTRITDAGKDANNRVYVNDAAGQALYVRQAGQVQRQLIAAGSVLGRYGIAPDPADPKKDDGDPQFIALADLNFTYQSSNASHPAATPTIYSVQPGDTLQSIARRLYGDSAYWYRIADANSLDGRAAPQPGQKLSIPALLGTSYDRADSLRPYDASVLIGDTTPTMPPPPADDGCGILGMIIVVVVAIVVAVFAPELVGPLVQAAGLTGTAASVATAALSAAVGSIASQLVGIAIGVQDGFSWKQVALAGISGGVTGGLSDVNFTGGALNSTGNAIVRGAVANAATQGIAVATGLQDHFDWRGVAAAGAGAGVGAAVGQALQNSNAFDSLGEFGSRVAQGTVRGVTAGLTTAVMRGGRVSVTQVAADAFGNALGDTLARSDWGGTARESAMTDFRRSEINAMNASSTDAAGSYWDTHPMMYAFNDVVDPLASRVVSDTGGGSSDAAVDFLRSEKAGYQLGDLNIVDQNEQFRDSERQYIKDNPDPAVPKFRPNVSPSSISNFSLVELNKIMLDAGIDIGVISVTSSIRTSTDQARIMYEQLNAGNISQYGPAGQQVIAIYNQGVQNGDTGADIKAAMTDKVQQLLDQGIRVSNHLGNSNELNVFDIAPSSVPSEKTQELQSALINAKANGDISNFLSPYTRTYDPAFHIEIKQPLSAVETNFRYQQEVFRKLEILQQNGGEK